VHCRAVEIQHMALVEHGRRQHQLDAIKVVVLQQLPGDGKRTGMQHLQQQAWQEATGRLEQILGFLRIGDVRHALRHLSMGDNLGAFEELVSPHMVGILSGC